MRERFAVSAPDNCVVDDRRLGKEEEVSLVVLREAIADVLGNGRVCGTSENKDFRCTLVRDVVGIRIVCRRTLHGRANITLRRRRSDMIRWVGCHQVGRRMQLLMGSKGQWLMGGRLRWHSSLYMRRL